MTSCVKNFKGCSPEEEVDFSAELQDEKGMGVVRGGTLRCLDAFLIIKVIYEQGDSILVSHWPRGELGRVWVLTCER